MTRPAVHVFLGDLHAGSKLAPLTALTDADGVNYAPSKVQAVLHGFLVTALAEVKQLARKHDIVLMLGGDLVDGVAHHGTTQTILDHNGQRALAVSLLLPWVNLASRAYGLLGTDAHVGDNGQADTSVCKELGVPAQHHWRLESAGRVLDWAHHIAGNRYALEGAAVNLVRRVRKAYLNRGERAPDLMVRHHVHLYMRTHAEGTDIATAPGWQAQTSFTYRHDPTSLLTVGMILWWPGRNEIKPLLWDFPAEPVQKVSLARQVKARVTVTR